MSNKSRKRDDYSVQYQRTPFDISRHSSIEIFPARSSLETDTEPSSKILTTPELIRATVGLWKAASLPISPLSGERERPSGNFRGGLSVGYHLSSFRKLDNRRSNSVEGVLSSGSSKIVLEDLNDAEKVTSETHTLSIEDTETEVNSIEDEDLPLGDLEVNNDVQNYRNFSQCNCSVSVDLENMEQSLSSSSHSSSELSTLSDSSLSLENENDQLLPESRFPRLSKSSQDNDTTVSQYPHSERKIPLTVPVSIWNKIEGFFPNGKHALAGGLAGIFVSVCLHPMDTVKSIIQAHGANQESLFHTIKRITTERGVMSLYRGIPTNLASSAPISAVYTFTYESAKGTFLPLLPKEYHSLAHCGAGGCASFATSFIFTPSERVKQQMQVHSCYQNSWNAFRGIIQRGGLPSLYAGWRAVLWRNVPHSIIKFYTYERLKPLMIPLSNPDSHFYAFPTLVCGGIAGSTAALFTTPFDVVKTRFQTQIPGSRGKQGGVLTLLKEISKREGFRGLYRGLTPRLLMYASQGAIFFGSYEFLKSLFSFEREYHFGGDTCHGRSIQT